MQQGKVQIDADWNEQIDIEDYHHRTYLSDLLGKNGSPRGNAGFEIKADPNIGYTIGKGNIYVEGILCQNGELVTVIDQPDLVPLYFSWDSLVNTKTGITRFIDFLKTTFPEKLGEFGSQPISVEIRDQETTLEISDKTLLVSISLDKTATEATKANLRIGNEVLFQFPAKFSVKEKVLELYYSPSLPTVKGLYIAYLDIWERDLSFLDDPSIREIALGGPDTATRTKIIQQVKLQQLSIDRKDLEYCSKCELSIQPNNGKLCARVKPVKPQASSCDLQPAQAYTSIENHLYRVEIHTAGELDGRATFKWSRDNGVVKAKIIDIDSTTNKILTSDMRKDRKLGFSPHQWVEIIDDRHELWGIPGTLVQLKEVRDNELVFDYEKIKGDVPNNENYPKKYNPKVRRWDSEGEIKVESVDGQNDGYIELEYGVQIKFASGEASMYNTGDYWLIPTRTATGDVEWPKDMGDPKYLPPEGITHHLSPLALLEYKGAEKETLELEVIRDCRLLFEPLTVSSINTGTISIKFNPGETKAHGPFNHYLQGLCYPPAIILGLVSDSSEGEPKGEEQVMFMEDYWTSTAKDRKLNFKAVEIGLQTFRIALNIEPTKTPQKQDQRNIILRWWAIPGREQIPQKE